MPRPRRSRRLWWIRCTSARWGAESAFDCTVLGLVIEITGQVKGSVRVLDQLLKEHGLIEAQHWEQDRR